jgi:hypothetical protein
MGEYPHCCNHDLISSAGYYSMQSKRKRGRGREMPKSKVPPEPEVLTSKTMPTECAECKSQNVECCEVTLNKSWRVYYIKCQKCHEVEVFKIGKDKK